jgi:signal transduction histidine kinase/CheY-like chemotaxis protein
MVMSASGWMRRRKVASAPEGGTGALARAAVRGSSLGQLLDLAVQGLLEAASADRAGLWPVGELRGEAGCGRVVESIPGPIPEQWKHLDISIPSLREALENPEPLRVEFGREDAIARAGPMVGLTGAIWIPLRAGNRTLGLAMVGYARSHAALRLDLEWLRARADEAALAIAHYHDTRKRALAIEEIRSLARLSRAMLCGVSVESILPQIARAARHHLQAEFVALGRHASSPLLAEFWDGPEEWRAWVQQEPVQHLWRRVLEQGNEMELGREVLAHRHSASRDAVQPALDHVIAFPIEVRHQTAGVVMAGLVASEDAADDMARLESYALLVSSALDREALREERAGWSGSLRRIVEESSEYLLFVDEEGRVCDASRAAETFLQLDSRRTDETRVEDLFSPAARNAVVKWRGHLVEHVRPGTGAGAESSVFSLEATLLTGALVRLHLRSAVAACGNGDPRWLICIEDFASQKARLQLETNVNAELFGLMDSIDYGVLLLDAAGKIRIVSDRFAQIMGGQARSLIEFGMIDVLIDNLASRFSHPAEAAARWRDLRRGDEASWDELELVWPSRKVVERFGRPLLDADGSRTGWLEVYRDITAQRLIQSKLLQTEKMAALGQLVSGIAHELNNPLTSIQGYAQLLATRRSASDRNADAGRISLEAARAARIVKNLLLFSREAKPERRAVNLNEVIERTVALRAYELKMENIIVDLFFDTAMPQALADAAQLQQVVLNLIVNAEQAIQQGRQQGGAHGRIHIRTRRLAGDRVALEISDDGPGIPAEIASRIFDPFFTTKPVGVGTGLGLSIVYGIVQEHGGEVSAENQPGHGAKLSVELPALSGAAIEFNEFSKDEPAAAPYAVTVIPAPNPGRNAPHAEHILVVEDEPTVSQLISDVMSEMGHRVDTLLDSREVFNRLAESKYDLIICDLRMPHLDGPGLYRELVRRRSPFQHKLLFVTGDTMGPRSLEFLNSNAVPYLAKPFLVEELKEAVRKALIAALVAGDAALEAGRSQAVAGEK